MIRTVSFQIDATRYTCSSKCPWVRGPDQAYPFCVLFDTDTPRQGFTDLERGGADHRGRPLRCEACLKAEELAEQFMAVSTPASGIAGPVRFIPAERGNDKHP